MFPYQPLGRNDLKSWVSPRGALAIGLIILLLALSLVR